MINIQEIQEEDIDKIISLFKKVWGPDYPFREFYDPIWTKKNVFTEDIYWLVAAEDSEILGSAATIYQAGDFDDQICEIGRLIVDPDYRRKGIGTALCEGLDEEIKDKAAFVFGEANTLHEGSQKILEKMQFSPMGVEPSKYLLGEGEITTVLYGKIYDHVDTLTNKNPHIIKSVSKIAQKTLKNFNLDRKTTIEETKSYLKPKEYEIDEDREISQEEYLDLLKIKKGRVIDIEVFGHLHINYGFFKIRKEGANYLIAKEGSEPIGAVGYSFDKIDNKVRIFEVIASNDDIKGFLCKTILDHAEELKARYIEVDVSAYSPRMQQTFYELGFIPVGYCPTMVFHDTKRLDVVRMAKINTNWSLENQQLTPKAREIAEIVYENYQDNK